MRGVLYRLARLPNDADTVAGGRVGRRPGHRAAGKASGTWIG